MPKTINSNTTLTQITIAAQKAKLIASFQAVIDGINGDLADTASFVINQTSYTRAQLVAAFQARIDAAKKVLATRTATHLAVTEEQAAAVTADLLRKGFKAYLESRYGAGSAVLQKYGFAPQKPRQLAASTTAQAQVLATATRKARGTVGKKTKVQIKGAPVPAPGAPPAAGAPEPAPAPAHVAAPATASAPAAAK